MDETAKSAISQAIINFTDSRGNAISLNIRETKRLTVAVYKALVQAGCLPQPEHPIEDQ